MSKEGNKTTEWKSLLLAIATAIIAIGGALLSGVLSQDGTAAVVVGALVTVAHVASKYITGRALTKVGEASAKTDPT